MTDDPATADRIGAAWLRAALAPAGDFGRRAEEAAPRYGPGDEDAARRRCAQIVRLAQTLAADGVGALRAALRRAPDAADIVSRAAAGDVLNDVDLFELGRFGDALDATARAWDAAGGPPAERPPVVPALPALLAPGRGGGGFYLADAFAPALAAARTAYAASAAAVEAERARLARVFAASAGIEPDAEEFILMRDRTPEIPPGVRIVRETPAYRLVALTLDAGALAAAARRDAALAELGGAEDDVRRELSIAVAALAADIRAAAAALGELDRTLARVAFTQRWGGCVPELGGSRLAFTAASFVPLRAALSEAGLPYTPISLDLDGVAVLTGPNMGGKSAALATCGFVALCAASGVPPPAERAELPLFETIAWLGGGAGGDRERLLSAFGTEVVRAREVLAAATASPALLLVDEFARTTGPREGRALLVALVEFLAARGDVALVATHYDGVARDAGVAHVAIAGLAPDALDARAAHDIHAALDAVARAMDYRVIPVAREAHARSDALALAGLLGLDPRIIRRAADLYGGASAGPSPPGTEEEPGWIR